MSIVNTLSLQSNKQIKINFVGGDFSSDASLLFIKEFTCKLGLVKHLKPVFKTNDTATRYHKDDENLWQVIFQIFDSHFENDTLD